MNTVKRKQQILLVGEDSEWLKELQGNLASLDAEFLMARNEWETILLVRKLTFDLVVLDNKLPRNNGIALMKYLRAGSPALPVIAFCPGEREDPSLHEKMWKAGANAILEKEQATTHLASLATILMITRGANGFLKNDPESVHLGAIFQNVSH